MIIKANSDNIDLPKHQAGDSAMNHYKVIKFSEYDETVIVPLYFGESLGH